MAGVCARCQEVHDGPCPLGRPTLVDEDDVLVGSLVDGRYHVVEVLGQGTTGTVFGVRHVQFPRSYAMKVLRPRYTSMDVVEGVWSGEASAAWSVSHACLPEIVDAGMLPDGAPYVVMERLEGETLATRLRRERLSMAASVDILMQVLAALDAIHARGLVVRELRPQNLFLVRRLGCRPVVKILDFGLARLVPLERVQDEWDALRAIAGDTQGNGTLAIPHYLSPERTRGDDALTPASDLFVTGILLYETLTGRRPFTSSSFNGLLLQIAQASPIPLSELRPDAPPVLEELVNHALSASPHARPASAREMQDQLRRAFEGQRASTSLRSTPASTPVAMPVASDSRSPSGRQHRLPPPVPPPPPLPHDVGSDPPARSHESRRLEVAAAVAAARESQRLVAAANARESQRLAVVPVASTTDRPPPILGVDAYETEETRTDQKTMTFAAADEIVVDFEEPPSPAPAIEEPSTSRGATLGLSQDEIIKRMNQEEETQSMQLTPELRARIDRMRRDSAPPPTRRDVKPTR